MSPILSSPYQKSIVCRGGSCISIATPSATVSSDTTVFVLHIIVPSLINLPNTCNLFSYC